MTALQVGSWQSTFSGTDPFVQSFSLTQAAASGRALVVFASGVNAEGTDTMSTPTFNGVAPTFSARRGNTEESNGTGSFISVAVWMNGDLPASAGSYNVSFAGANYSKSLSICEFSGIDDSSVITAADIASTRNANLTMTLASVIAGSLNFCMQSNNPGYSPDWVNADGDPVVYAGSGDTYCKPYLVSRHGATGTLNFSPTNAGSGESALWTNWRHGAAISLKPRTLGVVNGGQPIYNGQTSVTVSAIGFTGSATMTLRSGSITQSQSFSVIDSTNFTINTLDQGNLPFGNAILRITDGLESEDIAVSIRPATDNAYTNIANHDTSVDSIFYEYAPYATITQVEYTEADLVYQPKDDQILKQKTIVYPSGLFEVFRDIPSFQIRLHNGIEWSTWATRTLNSFDATAMPTFPKFCRSSNHMTLWEKCSDLHPYKYDRSLYQRSSFFTPPVRPGFAIRRLVRDLTTQPYAATTFPTQEFYKAFRDGIQLRLFELAHLRNRKQQVEVRLELPIEENDITRHEWAFRIDSDFVLGENAVIPGRSPREYTHFVGQLYAQLETDLGQTSSTFVEEVPSTRMNLVVVDGQFYMQPFHSFSPIRDTSKWVKFSQNEWVGIVVFTRWSRYHHGYHAVYMNGQKLFEVQGGALPTSSNVFFKIGMTANNIALSRRTISFKEVKIVKNPLQLLP